MWLMIAGSIAILSLVWRMVYRLISGRCHSSNRLEGKTVIITGASAGIGKETAWDLAERGARVILACRNVEKAQKVADEIINLTGNRQVLVRELELSKLASVRRFAKDILNTESALHILINNAGTAGSDDKILTEDGLELTMATNHYGHFLLTNMLMGLIKASTPSRIINVSSMGHLYSKTLNLDDLQYNKGPFPGGMKRYSDSKLANVLFTRELAGQLRDTGVTTYSLHPGVVNTEIMAKVESSLLSYFFRMLFWVFGKDEKLGAQTTIYLAVADGVTEHSGKYFSDCKISKMSDLAKDDGLAKKFWESSERVVNLSPQERHI